jgi:hypothetical protein
MSFLFSKSKLQSHHQCDKKFWFEVHQPCLAQPDQIQQFNVDRGTAFGDAVRTLYQDGILVADKSSQGALEKTGHYLELFAAGQKRVPLFEAAFSYNDVVIRADLLLPADNGAWELIEVKSGQLKPHYVRDAAIQALVITKSNFGVSLSKICVGVPNTNFVYSVWKDFHGILDLIDVTSDAEVLFESIESEIEHARRTLNLPEPPETIVGEHCKKPHTCGFVYHCTNAYLTPDDDFIVPVWHLSRSPLTNIVQNLLPKTRDLAKVNGGELSTAMQLKMKEVASGKPYYLDPELQAFLTGQPFPRYFLDYETANPPLPLWIGTRPNEPIPFQFSIHVWRELDAPLEHLEFLASTNQDPRPELAQKLIEAINSPGPIFAWNGHQVEGPITEKLCAHYPAGSVELMQIAKSCRDNDPLKRFRQWMYFPKMEGDWGLKSIARSILANNPYADLSIKNGIDAMRGYNEYLQMPPGAERATLKSDLEMYCSVDTAVIVDIWKKILIFPAAT